jgi:radical SAM superfamily enzyme YgiQ (UPF0313 family)
MLQWEPPSTRIYAFFSSEPVSRSQVWAYLAGREDVHCARLFTDASEPLPRQIDLLGFSFSWELDYANILAMLEAASIPIKATDRGPEHPLIFGGGPVLTANPEPYADWFDVVLLGDGEWCECEIDI